MTLTKRNPNRIHAIDCRCRGCEAPRSRSTRKGMNPLFYVLIALAAFWAGFAWLVWEAI